MKKICEQPFYTRYNPPPKVSVKFSHPSLTQQQFKQESDINNIIASVNAQGAVGNPLWQGTRQPLYGDFSGIEVSDYLAAQNLLLDASTKFSELPSKVRQHFNNNPAELLSFLSSNPAREKLVELGLAVPEVVPQAAQNSVEPPSSSTPVGDEK